MTMGTAIEAVLALALDVAREFAAARDSVGSVPAAQGVASLTDALRAVARAEARVHAALIAIGGSTRRSITVTIPGISGAARRVEVEDAARSEIALAAHWTEGYAQHRLDVARVLHGFAPEARRALADGEISCAHANAIADGVHALMRGLAMDAADPASPGREATRAHLEALCRQLDHRATAIARRGTVPHTRRAVTRIVDSLHAEGAAARRKAARADRDVWVRAEGDGNALLVARMSVGHAIACAAMVDGLAAALRRERDDDGSRTPPRGELRAEALATLLLGGRRDGAGHIGAHVDVVVGLDALLGLQDGDATALVRGAGSEEVVTVTEVRALLGQAGDVTLRRPVTDSLSGHLLDVSRHRYAPSERLRDFIVARDGHCRWPGCTRRAASGDLDHAQPFDDGGQTTVANLGALCRRHHLLKTHGGFDIVESRADGGCVVTTPAGARYEHAPVSVLPGVGPPTRLSPG